MPFGLKNGSSTFQKCMDSILGGLRHLCVIAYIDDLLVFLKCKFFVKDTVFLGYHLSTRGIKPDPFKMKKLQEWQLPKTSLGKRICGQFTAVERSA